MINGKETSPCARGLKEMLCIRNRERELYLRMMPKRARCAEVGVRYGFHAEDIVRICEPNELVLIDPEPRGAYAIRDRWDGVCGDIKVYPTISNDYFSENRLQINQFDFIYIDGDHSATAVFDDICNAMKHTRTGGFIFGDDYSWRSVRQGVKRAKQHLGNGLKSRAIWHTQFMFQVQRFCEKGER